MVDSVLAETEGPFFLSSFSVADTVFIPYVERMNASLFYYKGVFYYCVLCTEDTGVYYCKGVVYFVLYTVYYILCTHTLLYVDER